MANELTTQKGFLQANDSEYVRLVSLISDVWEKAKAKGKAAIAVNTNCRMLIGKLADTSWSMNSMGM